MMQTAAGNSGSAQVHAYMALAVSEGHTGLA